MTLVAISYNPPNTSNSSKWRKGLALLTSKLHTPSSKRYKNNTTRAAATEKILRHNSNHHNTNKNTSKTIVKCEDLTAKEFAQMAGIKIKTSEEILDEDLLSSGSSSSCNEEDHVYLTTKTTNTFNNNHQMTSISATLSTKSCHQIWESDFWQCDNKSISCASNNNEDIKLTKTNTNLSTLTTNNNDTLFISQLRSSSTTLNTIQKGRFKIVVGQDDCEPVNQHQQHHHVVLEWKRKRSDSSSANNQNITKK